MAIVNLSLRQFAVDASGNARIIPGNNRRTILPDIASTIDGWKLDGIDDDDLIDDDWQENETIDDFIARKHSRTTQGLRNDTRKERENGRGYVEHEERERLANLERYIERGFAFESPMAGEPFDDFDTHLQCEEV